MVTKHGTAILPSEDKTCRSGQINVYIVLMAKQIGKSTGLCSCKWSILTSSGIDRTFRGAGAITAAIALRAARAVSAVAAVRGA